jgi:hypothetical protein
MIARARKIKDGRPVHERTVDHIRSFLIASTRLGLDEASAGMLAKEIVADLKTHSIVPRTERAS